MSSAALLLQTKYPNRRALLLPVMSNNLALSDMNGKAPQIQDPGLAVTPLMNSQGFQPKVLSCQKSAGNFLTHRPWTVDMMM